MNTRSLYKLVAATLGLAVMGTATQASATTSTICGVFYSDANFGGINIGILSGWYYSNLGYMNDQASSVVIGPGCLCEAWVNANKGGVSLGFQSNDSNIGAHNIGWNDTISSIQC